MKAIRITYWVFTILLVVLMLFSAFASLKQNPDGIAMMKQLGYPYNVLTLLSIAKILGVIAILVPGFPYLNDQVHIVQKFSATGWF